jgi:secernin
MESICMHAGGFPLTTATTASMAVEYTAAGREVHEGRAEAIIWFTGTSYPCLSIFKPIILKDGIYTILWSDYDYGENSPTALTHWETQRAWIKKEKAGALALDGEFSARRDTVQEKIVEATAAALSGAPLEKARVEVNAAIREWYDSLPGWGRISAG